MLKISLFLLTISLSIPSLSQYTQSLDEMSRKEMKAYLLEYGNEEVQDHLKKYKVGQSVGGFLTISSLSMVIIGASTAEKNPDDRNDLAALDNLLMAAFGGIIFVTGVATLISSDAQFKKAEQAFLNPNPDADKKLEFEGKMKKNQFLNAEDISPDIKELGVKYQKSKKASKVFLISSITTLMVGVVVKDRMSNEKTGSAILNASALTGAAWLTTDIIANRKLREAKKLYNQEQGLTGNTNILDLDIRDDQAIYQSIFN